MNISDLKAQWFDQQCEIEILQQQIDQRKLVQRQLVNAIQQAVLATNGSPPVVVQPEPAPSPAEKPSKQPGKRLQQFST